MIKSKRAVFTTALGTEPSATGPGFERIIEKADCNMGGEVQYKNSAAPRLADCAKACCEKENCTLIKVGVDNTCYLEWGNPKWRCRGKDKDSRQDKTKLIASPDFDIYKVRKKNCDAIAKYNEPPQISTGFELAQRGSSCLPDVTLSGSDYFRHGFKAMGPEACARAACLKGHKMFNYDYANKNCYGVSDRDHYQCPTKPIAATKTGHGDLFSVRTTDCETIGCASNQVQWPYSNIMPQSRYGHAGMRNEQIHEDIYVASERNEDVD
jgi:hypothetical protein